MDFKNNKTIIIGASRAIGSKIAEKFAIQGSDLILIARNKELLNLYLHIDHLELFSLYWDRSYHIKMVNFLQRSRIFEIVF